MSTRIRRAFCGLLLAATANFVVPVASAHDVWLTFDGPASARRIVVNYGHPNDRPPAFADKVYELVAISRQERRSLVAGLSAGRVGGIPIAVSRAFAATGPVLVAARYDNGYWTKIGDRDFRNASRRLVPDAADSLWSIKFAKAVSGPRAPWGDAVGHDLEIVPLSDPAALRPGDTLRVRVLFQGRPLAGGEVERGDGVTAMAENDIPRFKTDGDGIASIPIAKASAHLLAIDHRVVPSATPELAAADLYDATLWFSIPAAGRRK